jgi:hypothetical protein
LDRFSGKASQNFLTTIVSGLPRSGTWLMMQMLAAGGMPILSDGERPAYLKTLRVSYHEVLRDGEAIAKKFTQFLRTK